MTLIDLEQSKRVYNGTAISVAIFLGILCVRYAPERDEILTILSVLTSPTVLAQTLHYSYFIKLNVAYITQSQ